GCVRAGHAAQRSKRPWCRLLRCVPGSVEFGSASSLFPEQPCQLQHELLITLELFWDNLQPFLQVQRSSTEEPGPFLDAQLLAAQREVQESLLLLAAELGQPLAKQACPRTVAAGPRGGVLERADQRAARIDINNEGVGRQIAEPPALAVTSSGGEA